MLKNSDIKIKSSDIEIENNMPILFILCTQYNARGESFQSEVY